MKIGILRERLPGERRVALVPDAAAKLIAAGHQVVVERGAGSAAGFLDAAYEKAGVTLVADAALIAQTVVAYLRHDTAVPCSFI